MKGSGVTQQISRISVIVPTRNERNNVPHFLPSLHAHVELVVVDGSSDGTDQMIRKIRPHNTVVLRSDARIAQARQIGAEAASGDWLVFTDADVRFEPGYFGTLAALDDVIAFYGPKYATAQFSGYNRIFNAGQRLIHRLGIPAASGSNMGIRRDVFLRVGGFRLDLPVNEDTELMMRVQRRGIAVTYVRGLAVRSLDDRRLHRGVTRKVLHGLARNALLWLNLYVPIPKRWLRHDWGYWREAHARRADIRDVSAQR
jgi:glycosyltransferase involved in cell wall biosynthesis